MKLGVQVQSLMLRKQVPDYGILIFWKKTSQNKSLTKQTFTCIHIFCVSMEVKIIMGTMNNSDFESPV